MSKPNINIPAEFAVNGIKTDFDNSKLLNGFDRLNPDVLAGDNLNKFIDDAYKGLNGVLELYDTKVDKSGDTMTGNLASLRNVTKGAAPSNNIYWQMINLDSAGTDTANRISEIRTTYATSGEVSVKMMIYEPTAGSTSHTDITLGYDSSKNPYFTFPNSTCVDGQWVDSFLEIAKGVTAPTTTDLNYSLSSYLPNDGYNYEVLFRGFGTTGTTNGDRNYFYLKTDLINNNALISYIRTRSTASLQSGSTLILPVGASRTITITGTGIITNTGTVSLSAIGYRRIGTNS